MSWFKTNLDVKHVRQMFAYLDSAIRNHSDTFLLALLVSWGHRNL